MTETVNERLRQQLRSLSDPATSIRLAELQGGTNSRIDLILQEIALTDCDAVQGGLSRGLSLLEHVVEQVEQCIETVPQSEQKIARDVLGACREDLRRFKEEVDVADVVNF